ncbi:MAG: iron chaperone [Verrucomicrobiia bacterium]
MKTATPRNIDEYIAGFPRDVQRKLQQIRSVIRDAAPDAVEAIRYRIPTFILDGNLVHFAGFQKHIGFYPTPSAIEAFSGELAKYERAKGSVQFPLDSPVPVTLIRRMVEFRVKETREKLAARKRK